jgi:hypothetical protein
MVPRLEQLSSFDGWMSAEEDNDNDHIVWIVRKVLAGNLIKFLTFAQLFSDRFIKMIYICRPKMSL